MVCYTVDEPEIARCSVDRLISEWWTEIDITVTNDGGKATYNFAVPPQLPDAEPEVSITCEQLAGSHTSNAGLAYSFAGKIPAAATALTSRLWIRLMTYRNGYVTMTTV